MHAFIWDCVRARTKLGMAMAANSPMIATTIMISTSVKPDLFDALIFILVLCFLRRGELSNRRVIIISDLFTYCLLHPLCHAKHIECQAPFRRASERRAPGLRGNVLPL